MKLNAIKALIKYRCEMDFTKQRKDLIKGYENIANSKWYFYYDETENFGKMRVDVTKESGYNNEPSSSPFMLGGLFCERKITDEMAQELINKISITTQAKDIKFRNVFAKNATLENVLGSTNLDYILDWLEKYNIFLHFSERNIMEDVYSVLFQSISDEDQILEKEYFRKLVIGKSREVAQTLHAFKYPHVVDTKRFWLKLYEVLSFEKFIHDDELPPRDFDHLSNMLQMEIIKAIEQKILKAADEGRKIRCPSSDATGTLTKNLLDMYLRPVIIFRKSWHYYDNENVIKDLLSKSPTYLHARKLKNYHFVNAYSNKILVSEEIKAVYICDWIIGIMREIVNYLRCQGYEKFYPYLVSLSKEEYTRFVRLCKILRKSREQNPFAFSFLDYEALTCRFEWLIDYEETLIRAHLYEG